MIAKKYFLLSLGLFVAAALSAQTTVLDDHFTSAATASFGASGTAGIGVQSLPTSALWLANGSVVGATAETYTNGTGLTEPLAVSQAATAYFEPQGSFQTLNVGDTLTLTVNFTLSNTTPPNNASAIRLGLFNSGSTGVTNDQLIKNSGSTSALATNYSGYYCSFDPAQSSAAATAVALVSRAVGANTSLIGTLSGTGITTLTSVNGPASLTNPGVDTFQATLTLNLVSVSSMTVSFSVTDLTTSTLLTTYTATSPASLVVSGFDGLTIGGNFNTTASPQTLTEVKVVYTPVAAATPTFSPPTGTFASAQSVTISTTSSGASIVFTTDGSTPTEVGGVPQGTATFFTTPVSITTTTTLKAIAFKTGTFSDSPVGTATYTIVQAAAPTFSPPAGTFTAAQSVTISTTSSGASIAYTTDGSTPTESGGVPQGTAVLFTTPVSVSANTTINAIAFETGVFADSPVATAVYTINIPGTAAAPAFSPPAGSFTSVQSVTLSTTTAGASIAFTTDGSTPTESGGVVAHGTLYSTPVSIGATTTLKAIAFETGFSDSTVTSGLYTITLPVATPVFSPTAGTFTSAQAVSITSTTAGASIAFTTDGSTPSESGGSVTHGTLYSGPVVVNATTTLTAIAFKTGLTDSAVATAAYTIIIPGVVSAPSFNPAAGTYTNAQSVTITSATSGASIAFTTDGSTPTESGGTVTHGTLYTTPVSIPAGSPGTTVQTTLKAIAFETGLTDSAVSTGAYTILGSVASVVPSSSASGGGGALDDWFLGVLAVLGVLRWRRTRR
jgi:hypothetical protein